MGLDPTVGTWYTCGMRVIAENTVRTFWERLPDAELALTAWYHDATHAIWASPQAIQQTYATASISANNRVEFNIRGTTYRLVVAIIYDVGSVYPLCWPARGVRPD